MNPVVIEHVRISDLPEAWRAKPGFGGEGRVTAHIDAKHPVQVIEENFATNDPAFGIRRAREDVRDVEEFLQQLRAPRYHRDGSRGTD
ncbi:MAG: hypothetical protein EXR86_08590 [Gammaproteobacteria bacterium]|nr:hypothetical protein [Gammaproteobacteria bacterium]